MEQLPGSKIEVTGKGDTIVLTGTAVDSAQIKRATAIAQTRAKTVTNLLKAPPDADPRQIVLQVKFASIDRTALTQIGFNIFSNNSKMVAESTTEQYQSPRFSQIPANGAGSAVNFADLLNLFVYRPDLGIGATIKLLQEQDVLQILAEPNLIAVDGKTASFIAGGQFPVPVLNSTSTGGSIAPVITVQWKPYGVQLDFTPTITPAGTINLKVTPEVSTLDYSNAITLQGFVIPAISTRRADTEVVLRDGETFAIAGLMDNRVTQTLDKVPGIGSIPIIGALFRSRSTKKTNTELLVLVTPHFVKPLTPEEKAKLPDFPITFLPSNGDGRKRARVEKGREGNKDKDTPKMRPKTRVRARRNLWGLVVNRNRNSFRQGSMSVQFLVILVPVVLGMMGFAIDLGRLWLIRGELNQAAASMALAAAAQLNGTTAATDAAEAAALATIDPSQSDSNRYNFGSVLPGVGTAVLTSTVSPSFAYFAGSGDRVDGIWTAGRRGKRRRYHGAPRYGESFGGCATAFLVFVVVRTEPENEYCSECGRGRQRAALYRVRDRSVRDCRSERRQRSRQLRLYARQRLHARVPVHRRHRRRWPRRGFCRNHARALRHHQQTRPQPDRGPIFL